MGEYLHLVTIYLIPSHIYTIVFFILLGGILASLNHTRFDINIPYLYSVKVHDVHHRLPESNYGQYTMFWDRLFGTYRDYNESRILKATGSEFELDENSKLKWTFIEITIHKLSIKIIIYYHQYIIYYTIILHDLLLILIANIN